MSDEERHPDETRRREDAAIRTEQKLLDFIESYKEDKAETALWRNAFDKRLKPLELAFTEARWPRRIILVIISSIFGGFGLWLWGKITEHIKP